MIRRVVLIVAGVLLLCLATGLGVSAMAIHSTFSPDGRLNLTVGTVDAGSAQNMVMDIDRFSAAVPYVNALGETRLAISSTGPVFVGIAATQDVDALIRGTTYAVATREGNGWGITTVPGSAGALPAQSLGAQHMWLAASQGSSIDLMLPQSRPITLLIAGAGPLEKVTVGAVVELAHASEFVTAGAIVAGVVASLGITLVVIGWVLRSRRGHHEVSVSSVPPNEG